MPHQSAVSTEPVAVDDAFQAVLEVLRTTLQGVLLTLWSWFYVPLIAFSRED